MSRSVNQKITEEISKYSNSDVRLGELLTYCIGRLCLKSAKAGNDWLTELNSIDVPHIVDWLKAAIINDDAWLKNVDEKNRPKKLMKFGSFEDIQKEADKAMKIANQKNSDIKLIEGDEELYMQLEGGYHLVKLLTPTALDREGAQMQHCIGGGAYDEYLNNENFYFLSLRDKLGKPHATLELKGNELVQLQGKQNKLADRKYVIALNPYFKECSPAINIPCKTLGYIVASNGNIYEFDNLPDDLEVNGNLDLADTQISKLPKKLKVNGNLDLKNSLVKQLPDVLKVVNVLNLEGSQISALPEGIEVGGLLNLGFTSISSLPSEFKFDGDVDLRGTSITDLPNKFKVGKSLFLQNTLISTLPDGLEVGGHLDILNTRVTVLPHGLKVKGNLYINHNKVVSLPKDMEVFGDIFVDVVGTRYVNSVKIN